MKKDLEYIISLSAGIGRSFREAEDMLSLAKQRKNIINPIISLDENAKSSLSLINEPYNICIYDENRPYIKSDLFSKELIDDAIDSVSRHFKYDDNTDVQKDIDAEIRKRCFDFGTGTYTPYGHLIAKMIDEENNDGLIMFLDGDDMHYWNYYNYHDVSRHINAIGKSLMESLIIGNTKNITYPRRMEDDVMSRPDISLRHGYVNRLHSSAGDEFLIELFCDSSDLVRISEKIIRNAYQAQLDMYKSS